MTRLMILRAHAYAWLASFKVTKDSAPFADAQRSLLGWKLHLSRSELT